MLKNIIIKTVLLLLLTQTAAASEQLLNNTEKQQLSIGVLAFRSKESTQDRWQPLADQLSSKIPEYQFSISPLNYSELEQAVAEKQVDFVLTNTAHHIFLKLNYQTTALVTLENWIEGKSIQQFAGVIFTLTTQFDINDLADLKNKTFAAVKKGSLGGYLSAKFEFEKAGLDTNQLFSKLVFSGMPHDKVVLMVNNGEVDAGTVRTGVLESMAEQGAINLSDFKILNSKPHSDVFPYLHSTELFPEWPLSKLKHIDLKIAKKVSLVLLQQPLVASPTAQHYRWNIPLDYKPVRDLLKTLKIRPFDDKPEFGIEDVYLKYQYVLNWFALLFFSIALFYSLNLRRLNRLLKRANKEIKLANEAKYRKLIENLQIGYFFFRHDIAGMFEYVSPSILDTLGYQPDEFLTHWSTFLTENPLNDLVEEKTKRTIKGEITSAYYLEILHKQGHKCILEISETAVFDEKGEVIAVEGLAHDVTTRKQLEDALEKEKQFLAAVLDSISDSIMVCDEQGILQQFNKASVETYGVESRPLMPQEWSDYYNLYEADGQSKLAMKDTPLYQAFVLGSVNDQELMIKPKNVPAISVIASGRSVIDKKGNKLGAVVSAHDITERKKHLKQLQDSLKEKEILLREVHHRVKNNMQVISSLLSLQIRKNSDELIKAALNDAQQRVKAMASVHELLYRSDNLAHINADKLIRSISMDLLRLYQEQSRHITLKIDVADMSLDLDKAVPLGLILNELLSNALKYAFPEKNTGTITIQLSVIEEQSFHFSLMDDGVGIPAEFVHENSDTLGIKLIMALSEQLHAEVTFDTEQGTQFSMVCLCGQS